MRLVICNHARACRLTRHEGKMQRVFAAAKQKHFGANFSNRKTQVDKSTNHINRPREGRIGDFGRQNSPPGEEANNRNTQQSPWRPKRVPKRYRNPSKARLMELMELMGLIPVGASRSKQIPDPWRRPRLARYGATENSAPDPPGKKHQFHQLHQAALLGRNRVREP